MCSGGSSASTSARSSCLRTRPPRPVPGTCERSMLCSAAIRWTTGEYRRCPLAGAGAGSRDGEGDGDWDGVSGRVSLTGSPSSGCGGEAAGASPAPLPPPPPLPLPPPPSAGAIRASTVPTSTVSSTGTRISATTPDTGAGTSVSILSVEISAMVASASIRSPTSTRQATIVPSATDTPIWGMVTSTRTSVREELTARLLHTLDAGQDRLFERWRERDRDVWRRDPDDRAVEVLEPLLGDQRGHLRPGRARGIRLVDDHDLRAASHRLEDRVLVQRHQRAQIEHLNRCPVDVLGRLQRHRHHRAVGDDDQVRPRPRDPRRERSLEDA